MDFEAYATSAEPCFLSLRDLWIRGDTAGIKILNYLKDPKLWELWYIPYYGAINAGVIPRTAGIGVQGLRLDWSGFKGLVYSKLMGSKGHTFCRAWGLEIVDGLHCCLSVLHAQPSSFCAAELSDVVLAHDLGESRRVLGTKKAHQPPFAPQARRDFDI